MRYAYLYVLNPLIANITTRGSSDSVSCLFIIGTIYFLPSNISYAGVLYGLAVHFRVYPIIYGLSLWLSID